MKNDQIVEAARLRGFQYVNLKTMDTECGISPACINALGVRHVMAYCAIVININNNVSTVAIDDLADEEKQSILRQILEPNEVVFYVTSESDIDFAIEKYYTTQLVAG